MIQVVCAVIAALLCVGADALQFAVIGDWGTGGWPTNSADEIRSAKMLNEVCGRIKCNFTLSCGDNIYVGNVMQGLHDSFEMMFDESTGPFFPSIGNHDNVGPQLEYAIKHPKWKFPKRFYSFKLPIDESGYAVEVFAVDTTDGGLGGGAQYRWLENGLHESTARWKFIFGHYPTVGSGRHKRVGTVGRIPALMKKYGAQAYFYGHDHIVEISNGDGRIYGLSGGMARGGMMNRGIGGGSRRFTLTGPSEYNQYKQDWGDHGFFTGDLSPNVLTLSVWHQAGGVQYEFSVTWDWILKADNASAAQRQQWPGPDIINKALREERDLPYGDELTGALTYKDIGSPATASPPTVAATPRPTTAAPVVNGTTNSPAPSTASTVAPPATTLAPLNKATLPLDKITNPPHTSNQVHPMYSVSAECCEEPTSAKPFTIVIQNYDITEGSHPNIFLSTSVTGCVDKGQRMLLAGTGVQAMANNHIQFTSTSAEKTPVFVCFSLDGKDYQRLSRINIADERASFLLREPGWTGTQVTAEPPLPPLNQPNAPQQPAAGQPTQWVGTPPPSGQQSGHSFGTLVMVGAFCLAAGFGFSYYSKNNQRRQAIPTDES